MAIDEANHLLRGVRALQTGDFSLSYAQPPLANLISAVPVAFGTPRAYPEILQRPPEDQTVLQAVSEEPGLFAVANLWFWKFLDKPEAQLRKARLVNLAWLVLMGVVVAAWSRTLWGERGGVLSMVLVCFTPLSIAMAFFVGNDLAAAAMGIVLLFASFQYWVKPSTLKAVAVGALGGAAVTTKHSLIVLLPAAALALVCARLLVTAGNDERPAQVTGLHFQFRKDVCRAALLEVALAAGTGVLAIWASYGLTNGISFVPTLRSPVLAAAALFLPDAFLLGLDRSVVYVSTGRVSYLLGKAYHGGNWLYFPVSYLVKSPIPELLLVAPGLVVAARHLWTWRGDRRRVAALATLGLGGLLMASSLFVSQLDIGFRHALPILPILAVLAGSWGTFRSPWVLGLVSLFMVWSLAETTLSYPHQLSYCNQLAGGTNGCYRYVGSASVDWGQDLGRVAAFQRSWQTGPLYVIRLSYTPPSLLGIQAYLPLHEDDFRRALSSGMLQWIAATKAAFLTPGTWPEGSAICDLWRYEPIPFKGKGMWMFKIAPERLRDPVPVADIEACRERAKVRMSGFDWRLAPQSAETGSDGHEK